MVPTPDMIESLCQLEMRLPEKGQFVYDFGHKLARNLALGYPTRIHVNVLTRMIERILDEYSHDPVCFPNSTERTTVAGLILSELRNILDHVTSPFFSELVVRHIKENEQFVHRITKNSAQTVH